jgi:hypothetical protein
MNRGSRGLLMGGAVSAGLAIAMAIGPPMASAASPPPPRTGTVTCALSADSTFTPALGYGRGIFGPRVSPHADARWRAKGALTACTGTQTGGSPTRPGPITHGELVLKAKAVEHRCENVTASGMTVSTLRIRWFDAADRLLRTTKATGTVSVAGLANGSTYSSFVPLVIDPDFVPPGIITFQATATAAPDSQVFPAEPITMTAVADQTISDMQLPCSYTTPPLTQGVPFFGFHGVHGPASLSVG